MLRPCRNQVGTSPEQLNVPGTIPYHHLALKDEANIGFSYTITLYGFCTVTSDADACSVSKGVLHCCCRMKARIDDGCCRMKYSLCNESCQTNLDHLRIAIKPSIETSISLTFNKGDSGH